MVIELVHVGFDNFLAMNRVIAVASVNSEPIRRAMQETKNKGLLVDMTHGRKTKAAIFTDDGHVFLLARSPETIAGRLHIGRGDPPLRPEQIDEKVEP